MIAIPTIVTVNVVILPVGSFTFFFISFSEFVSFFLHAFLFGGNFEHVIFGRSMAPSWSPSF